MWGPKTAAIDSCATPGELRGVLGGRVWLTAIIFLFLSHWESLENRYRDSFCDTGNRWRIAELSRSDSRHSSRTSSVLPPEVTPRCSSAGFLSQGCQTCEVWTCGPADLLTCGPVDLSQPLSVPLPQTLACPPGKLSAGCCPVDSTETCMWGRGACWSSVKVKAGNTCNLDEG